MHDLTVITTLAGALAVALVLGAITHRLGLSTLIGYILAGIVVGPFTPGFVADARLAQQMAEIGVILLMFGVGMHFHPQELLRVWRIAVPGAVGQSVVAGVAGFFAAKALGWSSIAGVVLGMSLAVASTVVLMRMLVQQDKLGSRDGHVVVGWLIVEDLFTVVALVVLPALAAGGTPGETGKEIAIAIGKAGVLAAIIWGVGTRLVAPVMERIARTRSSELFTLTVFVVALGVAIFAAEVFHVSVALGAFFAGLVVGQSRIGPQAAADMAPFTDVFSALFFVSIGMLFNPAVLASQPLMFAMALTVVLVVKPLVALVIVLALRDTLRTALTVAVGLAQIGEFSFILAGLGVSLKVFPQEGSDLLVATAIVSIALNPLLFRAMPWMEKQFGKPRRIKLDSAERREAAADQEPEGATTKAQAATAVVLCGLNELGHRFLQRCRQSGVPVTVVDSHLERLEAWRDSDVATVFGDAARAEVLEAANVASARAIVLTSGALHEKMRTCAIARRLNPRIAILATAESEAERAWLNEFGVQFVSSIHDEMSDALLRAVRRVL